MRRSRTGALLAELHAHTTWSDGRFSVPTLVDLYGMRGFDVLCITDHACRTLPDAPAGITAANYDAYLAEVEREGARAREQYGLLVVPGLELTYNDADPTAAAHAVAIGLREHVSVDDGIDGAIEKAAQAGAAIIAAHPYDGEPAPCAPRLTQRWSRDRALRGLAHRFELFNRTSLFRWVADAGLPSLATGDVHLPEHVSGWKTLLPAKKDEDAVVAYLRSPRPVYLACLGRESERLVA